MPVSAATLETAIKRAIPVSHLEIRDDSDGCGDKYTVLIVSEVRQFSSFIEFCLDFYTDISKIFAGKTTLARHRLGKYILSCRARAPLVQRLTSISSTVNELLKEQITQVHAFSQVRLSPLFYPPIQEARQPWLKCC